MRIVKMSDSIKLKALADFAASQNCHIRYDANGLQIVENNVVTVNFHRHAVMNPTPPGAA